MKTQTDNILPTYQVLGQVLRINYGEVQETKTDMHGNPHTSYVYITAISEPAATRSMLIDSIIQSRYSSADEVAIINNQTSNPVEYADYQFFRVQAKELADCWLAKTAYVPSVPSPVYRLRAEAARIILDKYPLWVQANYANGIYPSIDADAMKTAIASVITECNRLEDAITAGTPETPNWPTI